MNIQGILLDIDDTLYDYKKLHLLALTRLSEFTDRRLSIKRAQFFKAYEEARKEVHKIHLGRASSHNRLLYLQRALEILGRSPFDAWQLNNLYWDTFINNLKVEEGVFEFLESVKNKKICLLTDLTADIQHRKVQKMGLDKYVDAIVTSEEAGSEKPNKQIFILGLKKLGLSADKVCMIGDDFEKDIIGALKMGIQPFWLNKGSINKKKNKVITFINFRELKKILS